MGDLRRQNALSCHHLDANNVKQWLDEEHRLQTQIDAETREALTTSEAR